MLVRVLGTEVNAPVAVFQTSALCPFTSPSQVSTSPVGSRLACTMTIGVVIGAPHTPEVEPPEPPEADTVTATEALVVLLPAKSVARPCNTWLPGTAVDVSHATL